MGLLLFTDGFIFCVVVTAPAAHGKIFFIFFFVTVMAGITCQVIAIGGCMGEMIENHLTAVGVEFNGLWCLSYFEIFRIMTKVTVNRAFGVTACAILADTSFMDGFILARFFELIAVMTLPAVPGVFFVIVMAFTAIGIFEGCMHPVIKNNTPRFCVECHPHRLFLFL